VFGEAVLALLIPGQVEYPGDDGDGNLGGEEDAARLRNFLPRDLRFDEGIVDFYLTRQERDVLSLMFNRQKKTGDVSDSLEPSSLNEDCDH